MTKGVLSPRTTVERKIRDTTSTKPQAARTTKNMARVGESGKKAATSMRYAVVLAPQTMKGAVRMVARRSRGLRSVRAHRTPGTAQPPGMPPDMTSGMTDMPCSPKTRSTRSIM